MATQTEKKFGHGLPFDLGAEIEKLETGADIENHANGPSVIDATKRFAQQTNPEAIKARRDAKKAKKWNVEDSKKQIGKPFKKSPETTPQNEIDTALSALPKADSITALPELPPAQPAPESDLTSKLIDDYLKKLVDEKPEEAQAELKKQTATLDEYEAQFNTLKKHWAFNKIEGNKYAITEIENDIADARKNISEHKSVARALDSLSNELYLLKMNHDSYPKNPPNETSDQTQEQEKNDTVSADEIAKLQKRYEATLQKIGARGEKSESAFDSADIQQILNNPAGVTHEELAFAENAIEKLEQIKPLTMLTVEPDTKAVNATMQATEENKAEDLNKELLAAHLAERKKREEQPLPNIVRETSAVTHTEPITEQGAEATPVVATPIETPPDARRLIKLETSITPHAEHNLDETLKKITISDLFDSDTDISSLPETTTELEKILHELPPEIKEEINNLSEENQEKAAKGLSMLGFRLKEWKDTAIARSVKKAAAWLGADKIDWVTNKKATGDARTDVQILSDAIIKTYEQDASETRQQREAAEKKGNKKRIKNTLIIGGTLAKAGRVIGELSGKLVTPTLQGITLAGMAAARGSRILKEVALSEESTINETRITDLEAAEDEAFKIYAEAEKRSAGKEETTAEDLEKAYTASISADVLKRLEEPFDVPGRISTVAQTAGAWVIRKRMKRVQKAFEKIEANTALTEKQQLEQKDEYVSRIKKTLVDYDRMITQLGIIDMAVAGFKTGEVAGKAMTFVGIADMVKIGVEKLGEKIAEMATDDKGVVDVTAETMREIGKTMMTQIEKAVELSGNTVRAAGNWLTNKTEETKTNFDLLNSAAVVNAAQHTSNLNQAPQDNVTVSRNQNIKQEAVAIKQREKAEKPVSEHGTANATEQKQVMQESKTPDTIAKTAPAQTTETVNTPAQKPEAVQSVTTKVEQAKTPTVPAEALAPNAADTAPKTPVVNVEYQGGKSVWQEAQKQLEKRLGEEFANADKPTQTAQIDTLKNAITANPEAYGLPKKVDFTKLTAEHMQAINWGKAYADIKGDLAIELTPDEKAAITHNNQKLEQWTNTNPETPLTEEAVREVLNPQETAKIKIPAEPSDVTAPEAAIQNAEQINEGPAKESSIKLSVLFGTGKATESETALYRNYLAYNEGNNKIKQELTLDYFSKLDNNTLDAYEEFGNNKAYDMFARELAHELDRGFAFINPPRSEILSRLLEKVVHEKGLENGQEKFFVQWFAGENGTLTKSDFKGITANGKFNHNALVQKIDVFTAEAFKNNPPAQSGWQPRNVFLPDKTSFTQALVCIRCINPNTAELQRVFEIDEDGSGITNRKLTFSEVKKLFTIPESAKGTANKTTA